MPDLSVVIPARNEMFLSRTIEDLLQHNEADTEIIAVCDGYWPEPPIKDNPRVTLIHHSESIGQRAAANEAVKIARGKYIAKVDAHCSFDQGWDRKMLEAFREMGDDVTMAPIMRNLHAFDWVCPDGHRRYQSPSGPCQACGKQTVRDVVWFAKPNPQSWSYCFDPEPHFQYFQEYKKRPEAKGDLTESMSLQGSFFMLTRDKYWELGVCDEGFGTWGSQGIEVAAKTWLSGGRVLINHRTWYAHMFRTQGGDFGFPYGLAGSQVSHAKKTAKELFFNGKWEKQVRPLSWLVEKFWPVHGWKDEDLKALKKEPTKGILYYTDHCINMKLAHRCRERMVASGLPITSVTLKPTPFGKNIVVKGERGYLTMFKQILAGLEAMTQNIVYFCEHDVLYHPSHFDFTPKDEYTFYYNGNYWMVREHDGFAIHYNVSPLSGLVVYREAAIKHFTERVQMIENQGFSNHMGFEPFTHGRVKWKFWCPFEVFMSEFPNVDIAHNGNATWKRWSQDKFIRKPKFWEEGNVNSIPGWPGLKSLVSGHSN